MRRGKKIILISILGVVLLAGSIGGVALAQTEDEDNGQPETRFGAMIERVCQIYDTNTDPDDLYPDLDPEALKAAFIEAGSDMRAAAMENRLARMIENGVIDEAQAKELRDWWESKPEILGKFGFGGRGGFRGMGRMHSAGGMRGFGGPCASTE